MNKQQLHVVLGASGAIGRSTVAALQAKKLPVRGVERSAVDLGVPTVQADLLDTNQTLRAIEGASHVYMCVGLPYNSKIWQRDWPIIIKNIIDACKTTGARLIYFDNIYAYHHPLPVPFDETTQRQPSSKKGVARKLVGDMVSAADKAGEVQAVTARSADFYGPGATNSEFYISFLQRMLKGKRPQRLNKPGQKHTFAYSLDNGRAMVELALDDSTYGQAWHLPVGEPIQMEDVATKMNQLLGTNLTIQYLPRPLLNIIALFAPIVGEVKELLYQFDQPYIMSDAKFRQQFPDFQTTSYDEGIAETVESFR